MKMTVDTNKARKRLKRYKKLDRAILFNMQSWTTKTVKKTKINVMRVFFRSRKGRTGELARSIGGKTYAIGSKVYSVVGSGVTGKRVKYARIQEKGGTVKPRTKKWLTIPIGGTQGRAANFPNSFFIKSKAGNILLVERRGKKGLRPLFVLKKSVDIPARYYLEKSMNQMKPSLHQEMKPEAILRTLETRSL